MRVAPKHIRLDREAVRLLDCAASYVDRGWTQCTDAVTGRGVKVPPHSRQARCWCMLGALRAAMVRNGLARLVDVGGPFLVAKDNAPFCTTVMERALWAAARAILGRDPKIQASCSTIVTQWNDATATSGETVAQRLRDAAALVRLHLRNAERGIRGEADRG